MSLVGPRPMIASIIDEMSPKMAKISHSIRPGITGPWQVSVDGAHSLLDCLDYDHSYVSGAGLLLDLKLVALTAAQMVGLPKREKAEVMAMVASAGASGGDHAEAVVHHDPEFADVRNVS